VTSIRTDKTQIYSNYSKLESRSLDFVQVFEGKITLNST